MMKHSPTDRGRVFPRSKVLKIQCGIIRKKLTGYGICLLPGKRDSPKCGQRIQDWERKRLTEA